MKGKIISWIKGCVRIQAVGENCERFLNLCAYHNIHLWKLTTIENGYEAWLSLTDFWKLKPLVKKSRIHLSVINKAGIPFFLFRYRKRKLLFLSFAAAFSLVFVLSFFIWDIEIDGNLSVTDEKVMDYLYEEGITQGILKTSLDYKQLASDLRQFFPEITWVSVKLQGTRLMIDMKENTDSDITETEKDEPGNIISDVEGTVISIVTRAGTPQVTSGMEIKKGDLLVSGVVDLVNDSNEIYGHQYVAADADIYVRTTIDYEDTFSLTQQEKIYTGKEKNRILLRFGNLCMGVPFLNLSYEEYDCITDTKQFQVMENFYLPVFFSEITVREYHLSQVVYTSDQAEQEIKRNLEHFLEKIQQKGVQIFQNNVKIESNVSACKAKGTIDLIEKAGKRADIELEQQQEGIPTE